MHKIAKEFRVGTGTVQRVRTWRKREELRNDEIGNKAFLVWLSVMVPLVIALWVIGSTCESCVWQDCCEYIQQ
jgi:hypothetical protein